MLVAGLSAMGIYFLKTPQQNLLVSCIFLAFVGTGNTVINSAVVDLFPTKIRYVPILEMKPFSAHSHTNYQLPRSIIATVPECPFIVTGTGEFAEEDALPLACYSCLLLPVRSTEIAKTTGDYFRALAVCTATFAGRLGAVASNLTLGYVLDISCEVPIFLMGFILLCKWLS